MDNDKTLEKIRDSIKDAIRPLIKKGESMTPTDLENLTKAVCIIEKIKRIESGDFDESCSENSFDDSGNSYRRGRNPYTRRFVSRDTYHDGGSSSRSYGSNSMSRDYSGL